MLIAVEMTILRDDVQVRRHLGLLDLRTTKLFPVKSPLPSSFVEGPITLLDLLNRVGTPNTSLNNHCVRMSPAAVFPFRKILAANTLDLASLKSKGQIDFTFVKNAKERQVKVKHTIALCITLPSVPRVRVYQVNPA